MKRKTVTIQSDKLRAEINPSDIDDGISETSKLISTDTYGQTGTTTQHILTGKRSFYDSAGELYDEGVITSPGAQSAQSLASPTDRTYTVTPALASLPRNPSVVFTPPDFDVLFENPKELHFGIAGESIDEGVYSFDSGTSPVSIPDENADDKAECVPKPPLPRVDSVMLLTFTSMLIKNWENSQGLEGFRHRMAKDINHKYCSYCRCDDLIFIFLYVVFGIVYICAGILGLTQCSGEQYVNAFLIVDGVLSVFVFPITVMEWTKRIGGCVKQEDIKGHGFTFITIVLLRIAAVTIGSVVMAIRINHYQRDNLMCWTVFTLLEVGVVIEWAFLLFAMLTPLLLYLIAYAIAKKL